MPRPEVRRSTYICVYMPLNRHFSARNKEQPALHFSETPKTNSSRRTEEIGKIIEDLDSAEESTCDELTDLIESEICDDDSTETNEDKSDGESIYTDCD